MPNCPACESFHIVVVVSPSRRAFCVECGARWVQEGSVQRHVERPLASLNEPPPQHESHRPSEVASNDLDSDVRGSNPKAS